MPPTAAVRTLHAAAAAALAAAALAGCAPDRDVLARVGSQAITVADFLDAARGNQGFYPGPPDSAKLRLLDDLVRRELLVQAALRESLHLDPGAQAFRDRVERVLLRDAVFDRLVGAPATVSAAEEAELHRWRATESHCRLIFAYTRPQALAALEQLRRGADFAEVADRFNPPGMVPPGGELGYLPPGSLPGALDDSLRLGPVRQVIGPIDAEGQGWMLLWIEERRPREQASLDEDRPQLREILEQRKQRQAQARAVAWLRDAYRVVLAPGAGQRLVARFHAPPDAAAAVADTANAVLVRYGDAAYTVADAVADLESQSLPPPNFAMLPSVERWLESQALERAAMLEAGRRRLHREPEVERRLRQRLSNYLLDGFYQDHVLARVVVDDTALQAAYERRFGADPDAPAFADLPPDVRMQFQSEAIAMQSEDRLAALTDSLRAVTRPLTVHPDRLRRVAWPSAPAGTDGS